MIGSVVQFEGDTQKSPISVTSGTRAIAQSHPELKSCPVRPNHKCRDAGLSEYGSLLHIKHHMDRPLE